MIFGFLAVNIVVHYYVLRSGYQKNAAKVRQIQL